MTLLRSELRYRVPCGLCDPRVVFVFRDRVSHGQFKKVLDGVSSAIFQYHKMNHKLPRYPSVVIAPKRFLYVPRKFSYALCSAKLQRHNKLRALRVIKKNLRVSSRQRHPTDIKVS